MKKMGSGEYRSKKEGWNSMDDWKKKIVILPSSKNPIDITSHEVFLEVLRE